MELVASAFSSLATAFGGGATAAAGTAATTAAAASPFAAISTALTSLTPLVTLGALLTTSTLQGRATANQAAAAVRQGYQAADANTAQAVTADREAEIAEAAGIERRASLKQQLLTRLGEQDTAYAASGVDLGVGTPQQVRRQAIDDTNRALNIDTDTQNIQAARYEERAAGFRQRARDTRANALLQAELIGQQGQIAAIRRFV